MGAILKTAVISYLKFFIISRYKDFFLFYSQHKEVKTVEMQNNTSLNQKSGVRKVGAVSHVKYGDSPNENLWFCDIFLIFMLLAYKVSLTKYVK